MQAMSYLQFGASRSRYQTRGLNTSPPPRSVSEERRELEQQLAKVRQQEEDARAANKKAREEAETAVKKAAQGGKGPRFSRENY